MQTPSAAEMKSLVEVAVKHGIPMDAPSPSLADGFNGARDAATLARYDWDKEIGSVHVQSVTATRMLLKRAGVRIPKVGGFVAVAVRWDAKFKRLELAPVA